MSGFEQPSDKAQPKDEIKESQDAFNRHLVSGDVLAKELDANTLPTREALSQAVMAARLKEERSPLTGYLRSKANEIDTDHNGNFSYEEIWGQIQRLNKKSDLESKDHAKALKTLIDEPGELLKLERTRGNYSMDDPKNPNLTRKPGDGLSAGDQLVDSVGAENYRKGIMTLMGLAEMDRCYYGLSRTQGRSSDDGRVAVNRDIEPLIGHRLLKHDEQGLIFQAHLREAADFLHEKKIESFDRDELREIIRSEYKSFNKWASTAAQDIIEADKLVMPKETQDYIKQIVEAKK